MSEIPEIKAAELISERCAEQKSDAPIPENIKVKTDEMQKRLALQMAELKREAPMSELPQQDDEQPVGEFPASVQVALEFYAGTTHSVPCLKSKAGKEVAELRRQSKDWEEIGDTYNGDPQFVVTGLLAEKALDDLREWKESRAPTTPDVLGIVQQLRAREVFEAWYSKYISATADFTIGRGYEDLDVCLAYQSWEGALDELTARLRAALGNTPRQNFLQVGVTYRSRKGKLVKITAYNPEIKDSSYRGQFGGSHVSSWWYPDGRHRGPEKESQLDLIERI